MLTCIVIGAVCGIMLLGTTDLQQVIQTVGQKGWQNIASAAPADPGSGAGGFMEVFIYPHQATPGTAYASNLSEGAAYSYQNLLNSAMNGSVPYTQKFDIVYQVRYNATQAYNTTGLVWEVNWTKCLITCANLGIGADTAMTGVTIFSDATYLQMNFYINNGGAGYQLYHGQAVNITSFKMQYYG
jgi:hypothetical protein